MIIEQTLCDQPSVFVLDDCQPEFTGNKTQQILCRGRLNQTDERIQRDAVIPLTL